MSPDRTPRRSFTLPLWRSSWAPGPRTSGACSTTIRRLQRRAARPPPTRFSGSQPPEIGHLEKEPPLRFEEAVGRPILSLLPFELLVERAVADVEDRARDVGERGEEIENHPFVERVVFDDRPAERIFVDLV